MKAGWKTSEFWLSLVAMLMGVLLTSGVIPETGVWSQVAGIVCTILAAFGYSVSRGVAKSNLPK